MRCWKANGIIDEDHHDLSHDDEYDANKRRTGDR